MIEFIRINNERFFLNPHLIETVEENPDTVITLINGKKHILCEPIGDVVKKINAYYYEMYRFLPEIKDNSADNSSVLTDRRE